MDTYPSKPITDKVSQDMENEWLSCAASSMQGWRNSQEDSHNCLIDFDKNVALFAVYDGHGGAEVAKYASEKLPSLVKNSLYDNQDYEKALIKAFMDFDDSLMETPIIERLITLREEINKECDDNNTNEGNEANGCKSKDNILTAESSLSANVNVRPTDTEKDEIEKPISERSEASCSNEQNGTEQKSVIDDLEDKLYEYCHVYNEDFDTENNQQISPSNSIIEYYEENDEVDEPGKSSGATAVMALIVNNKLYVANAGDSRCVVSIGGKAHDLSKDHKPEDELELKRIYKAGGWVSTDGRVNDGINLSRALGDHNYKNNKDLPNTEQMLIALPDVTVLNVTPDNANFLVLASDGIWNSLSSQEVVDFILERINRPNVKLSSICEELFETCLAPNLLDDVPGCDNMTCIIIKLN